MKLFTKMVLGAGALIQGVKAKEATPNEVISISNNTVVTTTWGNLTQLSASAALTESPCDPGSYFEEEEKPGVVYCTRKEANWTKSKSKDPGDLITYVHDAPYKYCHTTLVPQPVNATYKPVDELPNPDTACWDGPLPDNRYGKVYSVIPQGADNMSDVAVGNPGECIANVTSPMGRKICEDVRRGERNDDMGLAIGFGSLFGGLGLFSLGFLAFRNREAIKDSVVSCATSAASCVTSCCPESDDRQVAYDSGEVLLSVRLAPSSYASPR